MVDDKTSAESKVIKILMGIPNEGHTLCESYDNRIEMAFHLGALQVLSHEGRTYYCGKEYDIPKGVEYQFSFGTVGQVFPALARERLAEYALEGGFDYLFMVDDDMICPTDLFELLIRNQKDICAALAFTRHQPHGPVLYNLEKGFDHERGVPYYRNYAVMNYPRDALVECDAVGFGAVLIHTRVLKAMRKPWFMTTTGAGEDIHFCHMARESGFKVFMDTRVKLGHLSYPKLVTEADHEEQEAVKKLRKECGELDKYNSKGKD